MSRHEQNFSTSYARVIKQLCEALLFEGCASKVTIERKGPTRKATVNWQLGSRDYRAEGWRGAFGRYRLQDYSIEARDRAATLSEWHPVTFEHVLDDAGASDEVRETLLRDLQHTAHLTELSIKELSPRSDRHTLGVSELETALIEGHPYHPCFKARSGFSDADHRNYGPEGGESFRLAGLMVNKALVHETMVDQNHWRDELGAQEWQRVQAVVQKVGASFADHSLLPLHPWQWKSVQDNPIFIDWLNKGLMKYIGEIGDWYRATQSVRTLMNADTPSRPHIKTALAMRNTSSMRILDPENVAVAPAISRWLEQVIDSDPLFQTHYPLTILPEFASIIVGRDTPLAGHLAAIWRQSPESLDLRANQMIPLNAVALIEQDGEPLIAQWVEKYGVEKWAGQLIKTVVLPVWHMMVAHGIGLEAHGQNLILCHEDGWPTGLIARDFHDSLEYVETLLSRPDLCPDLSKIDPVFADAPLDRYHKMAEAEALRELVMDTLFVFNLADLSHLLMQHYGFEEKRFWRLVRQQLDAYAQAHGLEEQQGLFDPFGRQIYAESLITQKINPGGECCRHLVPNALATSKAH